MTPDDQLAAYERVVGAARKHLESLDDLHASQVMQRLAEWGIEVEVVHG